MGRFFTERRFKALVLAATIATFALILAGNAVRVMDAAKACPDWPTCFGSWTPPAGFSLSTPLGVQYAHRALAILAAALTGLAALWSIVRHRGSRLPISGSLLGATVLMMVVALLGSRLALGGESSLLTGLHTSAALAALGLVTAAAVMIFTWQNAGVVGITPTKPTPVFAGKIDNNHLAYATPFSRLVLASLAALFVLLISGTLVSATGARLECSGWPLCSGSMPPSPLGWLALAHRAVVLATGGLLAAQFFAAWRSQRSQPVQLAAATGTFLFLLGQAMVGAVIASRGFPADLVGLHAAASAGLWAAQVILAASAGLAGRSAEEEAREAAEPLPIGRRIKDFVILSKPIIVLLLLVTTYAGMVVGGKAIPSLPLTLWTLLGGALAAGGSSALNQFIDRDTDKDMQRTAKRPIPDGRLQPGEGLAYGLGACLAAFFLLAVTVNLLAAVLSFAGMVYYVLIYSIWLKRLTVQNIVIGGGAGAIPPLVGWAAATGGLNVPALFLFAIIFLWTPPHFWALALVRRKDYARGRVPMLPVIRGEAETRKQIFIYTIELVALTLLMPVFKLTGTVYLISALALGLWLIHTAWRVYQDDGNKLAWKMYRYSSMYLAFLMLALVLDVLL